MLKIPRSLSQLIESFERLPGIGPKTAQRLGYYLLHVPQTELEGFADSLKNLKLKTVLCETCKNVADSSPCSICNDLARDKTLILVVEQPLDVIAIEKTGRFKGLYHVLHGAINPLENIGPDEIFVDQLLSRVQNNDEVLEIIIATNPTMEGDATALYLSKQIQRLASDSRKITVSRIGMGIPTGADLEYADEITLREALLGRRMM